MIKVIGKRLLISQCDRNIGVEGDNNTHRLYVSFSEKFLTDTFADGYGVVAKVASKKSEKAVSYPMMRDVSLSSDADSVWFLDLTKYILDQPGELLIQLEVTKDLDDGSGYLRWNSEVASLFVGASLESEDFSNDEAQLSAFEEVLSEIAAIGAETADNAKAASEHAESAQVASAEAEQALIEVNQKYDEFMGLTGGFEAFVEAANAHYDNKNNPHEVTAEQLNVYTKEAADKKFNEKADTSHTHPAAGYALVDLTAYGFSGNSESGFSLSMDTTTEPYTPADVSIFAAGDIIKLKFSLDGTGSSVTINDEVFSLVSLGGDPVTEPVNFEWEGELKAAVRMTVNDLSTIHVIDVQKLVDFGFVSGKLVENFNKLSAGGNIVHSNSLGYLDLSEYGMLPFNNETYPHEPPSSTEGLYSLDHAAYEVHSFRINLNGRHIKLKCELFDNTFISINDATLANIANETHRYCWEGVVKGNVGVYLMEGNGYISIELFDDLPMSLYYGQSYTKEETDALFENASLDLSYHAGERNNPHKVTAEQTGAYTKDETDALLNHLPENVTLGGENALDKMYITNFVNSIKSFSDLAITGTSAVTNFGEVFSPYNKTAGSRWIRISVNPAHFEKIAEMPYTISMTLRFFGSDVAVPLEIMGLYGREGDTDVRVTPMKDSWYMYPGYKKTFVFNLAPTSEVIKDAGFSIDLKAENYDSFQNMTFAIEAFSVIPAIDMDFSGEKPSFLKTGSIYHAVDSSFCENFSGNQVWFENGKIYSAFTKDIGYVDKAVAGAAIPVNHFLSNNTAKLGKVYTSSEVDALLGEKSDTSHIHGLATSGETVDLSQFGFKQSASGEYYVETNTETWEQADVSFMQAGDNVEIIFSVDGGGFVYINDQVFDTTDGYSISNYTWEGILKKPIRVLTSLCVIYMDVYKKGRDGFMSGGDKVKLEQISNMLVPLMISAYGMKNAFGIYVGNNIQNGTLTELTEQFFKSAATTVNETYTSQFYLFDVSNTPDGTKLADNAGLVCEPSTNTAANRDDYADLPLFACFDVNYTIDETTLEPVIHEIKGITDGFTSSPTDSFVGVLQMTGWVRRTFTDTQKTVEYRAQKAAGYKPLPEAVRASDNSVRPYVIHAKYAAGYNSSGKLSSVSGVQPATSRPGSTGSTSISFNGQIAKWREWGNQYCGFSLCDIAFIQLMLEIKYATLGSAQVMAGCRNYSSSYTAAVAETGVTRVLLTAAQGTYFVVGSCVSLGSTKDRTKATAYDVCDITKILSIEDVMVDGTAYKAVNLDTETPFNTTTATYIVTQPWRTGSTDDVLGDDGSPTNNTSGKDPFKIQGIEVMVGVYEVSGDTTLYGDAEKYTVYLNRKAADIKTGNSGTNPVTIGTFAKEMDAMWKYIAELNWDANNQETYMLAQTFAGSSTTGYRAAVYRGGAATTGWRQWMAFGDFAAQGYRGFACANLSYSIGTAGWPFAARACGTAGNRGEYKEV